MWAVQRCRSRLREEGDFAVDLNELASLITDRTKLIILNSPHNPTGGVLSRSDIEKIAKAIGDRNIMVLSDEIYSRLNLKASNFPSCRSRDAGPHDPAGRLLKDLCHDRLAAWDTA